MRHTTRPIANGAASESENRGIISIDKRVTSFTHRHVPQRKSKDPATWIFDCEVSETLLAFVATAPDAERLLRSSDNLPLIGGLVVGRAATSAAFAFLLAFWELPEERGTDVCAFLLGAPPQIPPSLMAACAASARADPNFGSRFHLLKNSRLPTSCRRS